MMATPIRLAAILFLFPAPGQAETLDQLERRMNLRFDTVTAGCAYGDAAQCKTASRRLSLRRPASTTLAANDRPALASPGTSGPRSEVRSDRPYAQQAQSVAGWVAKAQKVISDLRGSGALDILGALGGSKVLGSFESMIGAIAQNGGDIRKALGGSGLEGLAGTFLTEAKSALDKSGVGGTGFLTTLLGQLPQLASSLQSGQLDIDGLVAHLNLFKSEPFMQNILGAFGGLSSSGGLAGIQDAVGKFTAGLGK